MIRTYIRAQRKRLTWAGLIIIVLLTALFAWYTNIYTDERRVFQAMLENSLRTSSVTKQINQGDDSQTLDQLVRLQVGNGHIVQSVTTLEQKGTASAKVVTESLGTPTSDFVRYRSIATDQKGAEGNELDFSKVLGVWGKSEGSQGTNGELYNETVLGIIPFGNLAEQERAKLLDYAVSLDVYKVEYANVKHTTVDGRPAYEYTVKVLPQAYVSFLKAYAQSVGLTHLATIDPANYENSNAIEFKAVVDVRTRRLAAISYESGRQERYIAYGTEATVDLPKDAVSVQELQSRIQQVQ